MRNAKTLQPLTAGCFLFEILNLGRGSGVWRKASRHTSVYRADLPCQGLAKVRGWDLQGGGRYEKAFEG